MARVRRPFGVADLVAATRGLGVAATVLVQVLPAADETRDFLALAETTPVGAGQPVVAGVVGWVDLTAADVGDRIAALRAVPGGHRLVGLRHLAQDEADPDWLTRPAVLRGLRATAAAGLVYDLLVRAPQLPAAVAAVRAVPQGRFVLDHLGKPRITAGLDEQWSRDIRALAQTGRTAVKLSGLVTEADPARPRLAQLRPFVDVALAAFGPERVMAGSDWPVCLLAASYAETSNLAEQLTRGLTAGERSQIRAGTARRWYGLRFPDPPGPAGPRAGGAE